MTPSDTQYRAIRDIAEWFKSGTYPYFYLAGYAGTGKTTILPFIFDETGLKPSQISAGAFTGKAAKRMRQQGLDMAKTIHKLIYKPARDLIEEIEDEITVATKNNKPAEEIERLRQKLRASMRSSNEMEFILAESIDGRGGKLTDTDFDEFYDVEVAEVVQKSSPPRLVIVDECSMVPNDMANDLLSFGVKILAIGDPGQLPPVRGAGFFTSREPDFFLREVHRQAADNPIIRLATMARTGEKIPVGNFGDACRVVQSSPELWAQISDAGDQVLVGTHKSRYRVTSRYRKMAGIDDSPYPTKGEPLICCKNSRNTHSPKPNLMNGTLAVCSKTPEPPVNRDTTFRLAVETEDGEAFNVQAHAGTFEEHVTRKPNEGFAGLEATHKAKRSRGTEVFDFAYGITVHKAQGSEWPAVIVCNEAGAFRQNAKEWLYTAITRAKERLTIVERAA